MYYYVFKAISKDSKIFREYLYNEAVTPKFSKDIMMTLAKEFIKKDLKNIGLDIKDFTFTKKLQSYKEFRSRYDKMIFINNRTPPEIEEVPEEMKQSDEKKEANRERIKNALKSKKTGTARLPTSPYGAWAAPRDPNFKF